jgi:V/A-type H+/Na+-transporting ATPase subunit K
MNEMLIVLGWTGIYGAMALSSIGSVIGCSIAGQAAIGAMLDTESGHGRFVGVAAMPSSQTIYGLVVMLALNRAVTPENAPALAGIGILAGVALGISAIYQGVCCASSIQAAKAKSEILGLSLAPAAMVEGFAVFAFIFALVLSGGIPGAR